jgi:tetratricopeptide (TPR) repeat protein
MTSLRAGLVLTVVALGVLLLGLAPYPRAFAAVMRQAEAHRTARAYGAALDTYQQAAHSNPQSPLPWLRAGEVLLDQHRFEEAATAFREAEWLGAGGAALLGLGESFAGRGDWATAIKTWLRAQQLAPSDVRTTIALGRGSMAQGQFGQATRYLIQALELEPAPGEAADAHALLGRILVGDDPDQAASHFHQAGDQDMLAVLDVAEAEPDPARRALLLGAAFLQRDELALARHHFERAVALSSSAPTGAEARAYLGHTLDRTGETATARKLLEQTLDLDPDSVLARYFLGQHHRRLGNIETAQAVLWEALLRDPENAALRVEMGQAFLDLGDYEHAEEWFQGAVDAAPDDVEFQLLLAHFYLDHLVRIEERGVPAAEAAVALAPDDPRAQDLRGWAYYLAGRHAESHQALTQALTLDPELVSAHYHLGSLYAGSGQSALARQHLQRAADLDTGGYYRVRAEALLYDLK